MRDAPGKKGKFISTVALGEKVTWSGDKGKDEAGKDYVKIELSDGKKGWVSSFGVIPGAVIGAVKDNAQLFRRPDLLTNANQKLPFMNLVAITQQKDDWCQVIAEGKRVTGWMKKDDLLTDTENITVAILATRKLRAKDGLDKGKKIEAILANTPYPCAYFSQAMREQQNITAPPVSSATAVGQEAENPPTDGNWKEES